MVVACFANLATTIFNRFGKVRFITPYISRNDIVNVTSVQRTSMRGRGIVSSFCIGGGLSTRWLWADPSYGRLMSWLMHPPFDLLVSESVITDDQWHHIGLVYDIDGLKRYLYVDGKEVAKDTDVVGGVDSDGRMCFGVDRTLDAASFFSGLIDDVRIYDAALNAEEIATLAQ